MTSASTLAGPDARFTPTRVEIEAVGIAARVNLTDDQPSLADVLDRLSMASARYADEAGAADPAERRTEHVRSSSYRRASALAQRHADAVALVLAMRAQAASQHGDAAAAAAYTDALALVALVLGEPAIDLG